MIKTSEQGINLIKNFEGLKTEIYVCPSGYKTIGYGHVVVRGMDNKETIDLLEAENFLLEDIKKAEESVLRNVNIELEQGQFDALVSFTFNLGSAALQRSTLRQKINRCEYDLVPKEFRRWVYAGGMIMSGLVRRREAEVELFTS